MKATDIAQKAADLVGGGRANTHGDMVVNHTKIAAVWNGILKASGKSGLPIDAHDVANLMEGLKIARRYLGAFNADDYVDGAGYAACAGEIRERTEIPEPKVTGPDMTQSWWSEQEVAWEPGELRAFTLEDLGRMKEAGE